MNTVFDFQKPTDEKLSKWAGLLRSHESMLKKYVSLYTILFFGVTKWFFGQFYISSYIFQKFKLTYPSAIYAVMGLV